MEWQEARPEVLCVEAPAAAVAASRSGSWTDEGNMDRFCDSGGGGRFSLFLIVMYVCVRCFLQNKVRAADLQSQTKRAEKRSASVDCRLQDKQLVPSCIIYIYKKGK